MPNLSATRLAFLAAVSIALAACNPLSNIKEKMYFGSVTGVDACLKTHASSLLSETETKDVCIRKHQHGLPRADYKVEGRGVVTPTHLEATLHNKNDDLIVTRVSVVVKNYDADGKESVFRGQSQTWVFPGKDSDVSIRIEFEESPVTENPWCDHDLDAEERKSCKLWDIEAVEGVDL